MNLIELERALHQLRLGGIAAVLETRLRQAQAETMAPIDLISCLVADELTRRSERLLERRRKQAAFRDPEKSLDNFDFNFNPKMNRSLASALAKNGPVGRGWGDPHREQDWEKGARARRHHPRRRRALVGVKRAGSIIHAVGVRVGVPSSAPRARLAAYRVGAMRSSLWRR